MDIIVVIGSPDLPLQLVDALVLDSLEEAFGITLGIPTSGFVLRHRSHIAVLIEFHPSI